MSGWAPELEEATTWLAGLLWPGRRPVLRAPGDSVRPDFLVLPAGSREWVLVPPGVRSAALGGVRGLRAAPFGLRALGSWVALRGGRGRNRACATISLEGGEGDNLLHHLTVNLGVEPLHGVIHLRTPRAHGKPVLHLLNHDGTTVGFAKIGWNRLTKGLLSNEITWLGSTDVQALTRVQPPQVLHQSPWNGLDVLVVADVAPRPRVREPLPGTAAFLEVASIGGSRATSLSSLPLWQGLGPDTQDRSWPRALEQVVTRHGDGPVPVGTWHGDWVRQNCATRRGITHLWDWEFAATGAPIGLDVFHYAAQPLLWREDTSAEVALARAAHVAGPVLASLGLVAPERAAVRDLYPLALAGRYLAHARTSRLPPRVRRLVGELLAATCGPTQTPRLSSHP